MSRFLKVILVGVACGFAAAALSVLVEFAMLSSRVRFEMPAGGSGGLGAASAPLYAPFVAFVGFVVGAVWQWWRSSKREAIAKVR